MKHIYSESAYLQFYIITYQHLRQVRGFGLTREQVVAAIGTENKSIFDILYAELHIDDVLSSLINTRNRTIIVISKKTGTTGPKKKKVAI